MNQQPFTTEDGKKIEAGDIYWYTTTSLATGKMKAYHCLYATPQDYKKGIRQFSTEALATQNL